MDDAVSKLKRHNSQWESSPEYSSKISDPSSQLYHIYRHYHLKIVDGTEREFSYIGFASGPNGPSKRWTEHVSSSSNTNSEGYGWAFHRAIRKYGKSSFRHEILFSSDNRDLVLCEKERFFIEKFHSCVLVSPCFGYNMTMGGDGTFREPITKDQIALLAEHHKNMTGRWPTRDSGSVIGGSNGDTWFSYDKALRNSGRGIPDESSLAQLLSDRFGVPNKQALPRLTEDRLIELAVSFKETHGKWPNRCSGCVTNGSRTETWLSYNRALIEGGRGLPGGSSLAKLLAPLKNRPRQDDSG